MSCGVWALAAMAAPGPAVETHTQHQFGIALFPTGVQYIFEGEARVPLWRSDHLLLKDAHVAVIGHAELTPSFPRAGLVVRVAPVAFWDLTLRAWGTWYFGSFSSILPFDDPSFAATTEGKAGLVEAGVRTDGWATRLDVETRLKGRVGPVILVLELQVRHHEVSASSGAIEWFWEPTEMLNVPAVGEVINRNAYLFYELNKPAHDQDRKLWIGAIAFWQWCPQSLDQNVRIGPVMFWKPAPGPRVPTLILGAQAWVESGFTPVLPPYTFLAASWAQ